MTEEQRRKRLKLIKATPLKDRVRPIEVSRRGKNYVAIEMEENSDFDDFFDFEEDLAKYESARKQSASAASAHTFFESSAPPFEEAPGFLVMEDEVPSAIVRPRSEPTPVVFEEVVSNEEPKKYTDVVGFQFIRCEYLKKDGEQCKRQAPKGKTICSSHRKMIKKDN
jgi:hypothetical protein